MQNHLCAHLLALDDSTTVLDTARRGRKERMVQRRLEIEALHERDFMESFNFVAHNDRPVKNNEVDQNDENDEVAHLSQSMSQLSSQ